MISSDSDTIVVGMSGGVDSSVAAALLKRQGHRVVGLFMKNWDETRIGGACTAVADYEDVARVCDRLDIPYYSVDFVQEYWDAVFEDFLKGYREGITPNPDVLCNREIKFHHFLNKARQLGATKIATGHYVRVGESEEGPALLKGRDPQKDQSYFLCEVGKAALDRSLFPVGELEKSEVRAIANELGLPNHAKKDSTGICFVGERDFRGFLKNFVRSEPGEFQLLDGTVVGDHVGAPFYTIGQRKGLGLGGEGEPWFVVKKDIGRNVVFVERGVEHAALFADDLVAVDPHWIGEPPRARQCTAKIRYRQADQECAIDIDGNNIHVSFTRPQRAITPGQSVVFYEGDRCLGGARIQSAGSSYFDRGLPLPH